MKPKHPTDRTGRHPSRLAGKKPIKTVARQVRRPVQARGIATVEALLEAAALILSKDDLGRFTTNRVAKVAGVGIGSLYEYFPDKHELLAELIERFAADIKDRMTRTFLAQDDIGIEAALKVALDVVVEFYRSRAELHRQLLEQAPYLSRTNPLDLVEEPIRRALVHMLRTHSDEIIVEDFEIAATAMTRIGRTLIQGAHIDPFMPLDLDAVRAELLVIFRRYLTGRP